MCENLRAIPDTVWAAVLASLLTLSGVILTNFAQNKRFLRQLDYDHKQRNRERQLRLKQEVFLNAVEGLTNIENAISNMGNLEIEYGDIGNRFSAGAAAVQRVYVVASNKTVSALAAYLNDAGVTLLGLVSQRNQLCERHARLKWLQAAVQKSLDEKDRLLALMKEATVRGITDVDLWRRLKDIFDYETKQGDEWAQDRDETIKVQTKALMEMLKRCYSEQMRLSRLATPLLAAVREELELEFNVAEYEALIISLAPRAEKAINDLVGDMSRDIMKPGSPI